MVLAVDQAQQRRLATAVGAFDEGVLALLHGPGEILQDQPPLIARVDAAQLDQRNSRWQWRGLIARQWRWQSLGQLRLPAHDPTPLLTVNHILPAPMGTQHQAF